MACRTAPIIMMAIPQPILLILPSLSPARDGLIKKGLIYSSERGLIAFTVPHFGKFLRSQPV